MAIRSLLKNLQLLPHYGMVFSTTIAPMQLRSSNFCFNNEKCSPGNASSISGFWVGRVSACSLSQVDDLAVHHIVTTLGETDRRCRAGCFRLCSLTVDRSTRLILRTL